MLGEEEEIFNLWLFGMGGVIIDDVAGVNLVDVVWGDYGLRRSGWGLFNFGGESGFLLGEEEGIFILWLFGVCGVNIFDVAGVNLSTSLNFMCEFWLFQHD